jgi:hypothetical protein
MGAVVVVIAGSPPLATVSVSSVIGDRVRLLLHASSPSANLFAMSIRSDTVFGLILPVSLTRSPHCNPSMKASIALLSETSNVEFFIGISIFVPSGP